MIDPRIVSPEQIKSAIALLSVIKYHNIFWDGHITATNEIDYDATYAFYVTGELMWAKHGIFSGMTGGEADEKVARMRQAISVQEATDSAVQQDVSED